MATEDKRQWYKKKRFIIPAIALTGLILSSSGSNSSPQNLVRTSSVPALEQSATVNYPQNVPEEKTSPVNNNLPSNSGSTYVNVDGNTIPSPVRSETIPYGATAHCNDGTYSFSQHRQGTCSHHGGVASWL